MRQLPPASTRTGNGDGKPKQRPRALFPGEQQPTPFALEMWDAITFKLDEEFLIDGIMPRQGVGLIYGASQTFKSFIVLDVALHIAQGKSWANRETEQAAVAYLAAEGAAGIRKRRAGYVATGRAPANGVPFALISAAPNLGTGAADYERLVATIAAAGINPGLIVIDTVAKVIGGADENGAGMAQLLLNAEALSQHFKCFVLCVHHVGHDAEKQDRPRGWSGLSAALDLQMFADRKQGDMSATVTVQKLKDEPSGVRFNACMERIALGVSKTGREVSTLVVSSVTEEDAPLPPPAAKPKAIAPSRRLLMTVVIEAIEASGRLIKPFGNGPFLKAAPESLIRETYFARVAEKADPDEDRDKLHDRQRNNFRNALHAAIDAETLVAQEIEGERFVWTP